MGKELLAMLTILPPWRAIIPGNTAREHRMGPRRLTSSACHHSSTSVSQKGPMGPCVAALLTSRLTGPSERSIVAMVVRTASASATSALNACARPRLFWIIATVSANSDCDRASTTVYAPAAASASAMARPMPRPPPVTTTICPSNSVLFRTGS